VVVLGCRPRRGEFDPHQGRLRSGEVVTRLVHTQEIDGAIPSSAIRVKRRFESGRMCPRAIRSLAVERTRILEEDA
jgi:hypothetical protein